MSTILDLSAAAYHADENGDGRPSLTRSTIHTLCTRSPLHAWTQHPRLNPDYRPRPAEVKFDVGTVVHALLLEQRPHHELVAVVDAADWRTQAAKDERDSARESGLIPLLQAQWEAVQEMVTVVAAQLSQHLARPPLLADGRPEQTIVWEEQGILCRARLDWLHDDLHTIDDLKTTSRSAHPDAYARRLYDVGGDIQAAFYLRGLRAYLGDTSHPHPTVFRWLVCETSPPYAVSVLTPGPAVLALADRKINFAIQMWRRCLESGIWPAYPAVTATAELPTWEEAQWLDREAYEEMAAG